MIEEQKGYQNDCETCGQLFDRKEQQILFLYLIPIESKFHAVSKTLINWRFSKTRSVQSQQ